MFYSSEKKLNFKDVLIVPKSSKLNSRKDVVLDTKILYQESKNNYDNVQILDKETDIFKIKNSKNVNMIKNNKDFYIFKNLEDDDLTYSVSIKNNIFKIFYPEINEERKYKINATKKIEYNFHWSNRFLNNIFNK